MKKIHENDYIADGAKVVGDVEIGKDSSVWYNAVVRGDSCKIVVGNRTNIQDLACLHVDKQYELEIGDNVTVGHNAIVHGCKVGNNVLIGMGSIIMKGAQIGDNCIIGAGAVVTENSVIPERSLAYGCPAKVIRELNDKEIEDIMENAEIYVQHAYKAQSESNR